jgi:hypothetical protein
MGAVSRSLFEPAFDRFGEAAQGQAAGLLSPPASAPRSTRAEAGFSRHNSRHPTSGVQPSNSLPLSFLTTLQSFRVLSFARYPQPPEGSFGITWTHTIDFCVAGCPLIAAGRVTEHSRQLMVGSIASPHRQLQSMPAQFQRKPWTFPIT